uniref:Uncharacterized protein n=1 Tax=Nymphaea colorata TaxID=210225 RepID=A0A5K1AZU6_9MAGN
MSVYYPSDIPDPNYVRIFDIIYHDREQLPGTTMTSKEKLNIAMQLSRSATPRPGWATPSHYTTGHA